MIFNLTEHFTVAGTFDVSRADTGRWVAIIGSREAKPEELDAAYWLGRMCAKQGYIVVSGLAKGIDTKGMEGCLDAGGTVVAIVSTTASQRVYPKENASLAERIRKQGCIIHPYSAPAVEDNQKSGLNQFQRRLIERDALVAWLCPNVTTVKATDEPIRGGTKWAMNYAEVYGRTTFRLDAERRFHRSPQVEKSRIWWDMKIVLPQPIEQ